MPRKPTAHALWSPAEIIAILDEAYGRAPQQASADPLFELVLTLLSQHTSDHNSGEAMHRLVKRFPTGDAGPRRAGRG